MKNRLKSAREAIGLSQKAVAVSLKVSTPTVSEWESGKKNPTIQNLKQLSKLYKVSMDYLIYGEQSDTVSIGPSVKKIRTPFPVSILVSQYSISADILSSIAGVPRDIATLWSIAKGNPSDEEYDHLAEFFEIDAEELKAGVLPLFPKNAVTKKITSLSEPRFAAFGKENEDFTQKDIEAISKFWDILHEYKGNQ